MDEITKEQRRAKQEAMKEAELRKAYYRGDRIDVLEAAIAAIAYAVARANGSYKEDREDRLGFSIPGARTIADEAVNEFRLRYQCPED